MAIAPIPPWESFGFPDVLNFGVQGARLGLERAGQTLGANEASDRLALSYAQLASENARHAASLGAEQQRAAQADALRRQDSLTALGQWNQEMEQRRAFQGGELASRSLRDALALHKAQTGVAPKLPPEIRTYKMPDGRLVPYIVNQNTGQGSFMPSGEFNPHNAATGLSDKQIAIENLRGLRKEQADIAKKWSDQTSPGAVRKALADPKSEAFKSYQADQARLKSIEGEIKKILTPAPAATPGVGGNALTTPGTDISMPDETGMDDPLGILGGTNNASGVPQ